MPPIDYANQDPIFKSEPSPAPEYDIKPMPYPEPVPYPIEEPVPYPIEEPVEESTTVTYSEDVVMSETVSIDVSVSYEQPSEGSSESYEGNTSSNSAGEAGASTPGSEPEEVSERSLWGEQENRGHERKGHERKGHEKKGHERGGYEKKVHEKESRHPRHDSSRKRHVRGHKSYQSQPDFSQPIYYCEAENSLVVQVDMARGHIKEMLVGIYITTVIFNVIAAILVCGFIMCCNKKYKDACDSMKKTFLFF